MDIINFTVHGVPISKARARAGRNGHYTPKKTKDYERLVYYDAVCAMIDKIGKKPFDGPVFVKIAFHIPIPESWSKKKKTAAIMGDIMPVSKPDLDNLTKSILDAMNVVIYNDDSQIIFLMVAEKYSINPRSEITVSEYNREFEQYFS